MGFSLDKFEIYIQETVNAACLKAVPGGKTPYGVKGPVYDAVAVENNQFHAVLRRFADPSVRVQIVMLYLGVYSILLNKCMNVNILPKKCKNLSFGKMFTDQGACLLGIGDEIGYTVDIFRAAGQGISLYVPV
ncbi:hypothetical protein SDC9_158560 [bioreactor metagenome]|uniref:Uncharacterized protein n=1 Tax=bioreactor metagenome TaxID=1076179 RepID=A0A645FD19_9ZZZZ